jgi:hypothetical protein
MLQDAKVTEKAWLGRPLAALARWELPLAFDKVFLECQAGKVDSLTKSLKKKE